MKSSSRFTATLRGPFSWSDTPLPLVWVVCVCVCVLAPTTKTERIAHSAADELDIKDPSTDRLISWRSQWAAVPAPSVLFKGDYPTTLRLDSEKCDSPDQASRVRPALDQSGYRLSTSCSRGGGGGAAKKAARIRRLANHGPAGKRRGTPWCNHSPTALWGQTRKEKSKK